MTLEWKPSADEDAVAHALRRAYAAHWQEVKRLQLENEQLRKAATPRTPAYSASDGLELQSVGRQSMLASPKPNELLVLPDRWSKRGASTPRSPVHWSRRGASTPRSPRRDIPSTSLQVLASGGGGNLPGIVDTRAHTSTCPDDSQSESSNMKNEASAGSRKYQLRDHWTKGSSGTGGDAGMDQMLVIKSLSSIPTFSVPSANFRRTTRGLVRSVSLSITDFQCIDPESSKRIAWDLCSVALLVYDCVMLPLSFFKLGFGSFATAVNLSSTIFWTLDIVASFATGFYRNGFLQTSPALVARNYAKTWLCFDTLVTSLEWIMMFVGTTDDSDGKSSLSGMRIVRFIRFARILRAIKLSVLASKLARRVNNVTMLLGLRLVGSLSVLVMVNHATAALWYMVGDVGDGRDGWMRSRSFESRSKAYHYLTSLHWSITNFHGTMDVNPGNERERAFTCFVLLLGIVGFSTFVGSITNSISMVQNFHEVRTRKYHMLCKYLVKHSISGALSAKAKRSFEEQLLVRQQEEEIDISTVVAGSILDELHEEARTRHTMSNTLFCMFCTSYPRVVRHLCRDAMAEQHSGKEYNFFFHGDTCDCVTILMTGIARYVHHSNLSFRASLASQDTSLYSLTCSLGETINDNRWICEMVLWTHWVCCGWLGTISECQVLTIDQNSFGQILRQYEHARHAACDYARQAVDSLHKSMPSDLLEVSPDLSSPAWPSRPSSKRQSFFELFSSS